MGSKCDKLRCLISQEMAGPFNRGRTIINKLFTITLLNICRRMTNWMANRIISKATSEECKIENYFSYFSTML